MSKWESWFFLVERRLDSQSEKWPTVRNSALVAIDATSRAIIELLYLLYRYVRNSRSLVNEKSSSCPLLQDFSSITGESAIRVIRSIEMKQTIANDWTGLLTELVIRASGQKRKKKKKKNGAFDRRSRGVADTRESAMCVCVCDRAKENDMVNDLFAFLRSFTER